MNTTVRSVRVELELGIASYVANAKIAGRETDAAFSGVEARIGRVNASMGDLDKSTSGLAKTSASARVQQSGLGREVEKTGRSSDTAGRSIDKYSGRLSVFLKLAAGLGPALLPVAALGIPALAGLAAQGGFAAGALGASVLALRGVGDAVKALEKARLDPTIENMNAAQQVLNRMGPDAANLVLHLDALTSVRDKLQASAASGFIPGLDEALTQLEDGVPVARRLLHEFGDISGDILARGAKGLTSDRFTEFFQYLQTNARPILNDTATALGHIAHAFASIFTATAGDQRAFTSFLRNSTEDFDHWATRLDSNQSFQDFLAYARENGPAVADALGSIVEAFAAIVEAAAPLGGPTLQIVTALADVIAAIASSPIGSPILTAISAYSLLSTVLPGVKKGYEGIATAQGKIEAQITSGRGKLTTLAGDMRNVAKYGGLASESSSRLRGQLGPLIKGGAGLAGLAIASSGAADGMGLTSTASLALLGYMVGGAPGAVAGGLVGAVKDFTANAGDADAATKRWNANLKDGQTSLSTYSDILQGARDELGKMDDIVPTSFGDALIHGLNPQSIKLSFRALFGNLDDSDLGKQADEVARLNDQYEDLITTATILGQATGQIDFGDSASMEQLTEVLVRAKPAMDGLGISTDDLMAAMRDGSILDLITRIEQYQYTSDSAVGKTLAVKDAIASLDDGLTTTAQSAQSLSDSLDALLGPQLGLSAATDQWTTALRHLSDDLDKNNHTLQGNSDAAIKNRAAIRDRVGALTDVLVSEAQAGASASELSAHLRAQRTALIDAGHAAGISKGDMRAYLDVLGLTPGLVKTLIQADTAQATAAIRALQARMAGLKDRTVHVNVVTSNVRPMGGQAPTEDNVDPPVHHKAGGGTVPGPRTPYGDKVLIHAAPGEEVITNRHGEADRFRSDRASGRIPAYADGGRVARGLDDPLFTSEGPRYYKAAYKHNKPFALDGPSHWDWPYQTTLSTKDAAAFEAWATGNPTYFDPSARIVDYDMRGFWKKKRPASWHEGDHFPDTWKTPYDTTFSHESKYATKDNPFYWHGDKLIDTRNGQVVFASDGATLPKGGPYVDSIPLMAAPGERVISNRHGQVDKHAGLLDAINADRMADGGTVGDRIRGTYTTRYRGSGDAASHGSDQAVAADTRHAKAADAAAKALRDLEQQARKLQRTEDKIQAKRDALQSHYDSVVSSTTSQLTSNIFATSAASTNPWAAGAQSGGAMDPIGVLQSDIANASTYDQLVEALKKRGLSQSAIEAIAAEGLPALQAVAGYSDSALAQFQQLFTQREQLVGVAAADTGTAVVGKGLEQANSHLERIEDRLHDVEQAIKAADNHNTQGQSEQAAHFVNGVNGAASTGHRRRT